MVSLMVVASWEELQELCRSPELGAAVAAGKLEGNPFRPYLWRMFLGELPNDVGQWETEVARSREAYSKHVERFFQQPPIEEGGMDHPLSNESSSLWSSFFENNELRKTIQLDLDRTHPEQPFFQQEDTQTSLCNILFVWSKLHPEMSYRQGMNELLAPILLLISKREVPFDTPILDVTYHEHDAFATFSTLMKFMYKYYCPNTNPHADGKNQVTVTSETIQNKLLRKLDLRLADHLARSGVEAQVYGIRWLRVLFLREFPMKQCLILWDSILYKNSADDFPFAHVVILAMLLHLRPALMEGDVSACLGALLRFPRIRDIHTILGRALDVEQQLSQETPSADRVVTTTDVVHNEAPVSELKQDVLQPVKQSFMRLFKGATSSLSKPRQDPTPSVPDQIETIVSDIQRDLESEHHAALIEKHLCRLLAIASGLRSRGHSH